MATQTAFAVKAIETPPAQNAIQSLTTAELYVLVLFMSEADDMQARHRRVLAELTELGLELARDAQARALEAAEPQAVRDLTLAFQRATRTVRQTLALEAKLAHDAARAEHEASEAARKTRERRLQRRREQVEAAVKSLAWTEGEGLDAYESLDADLSDLLGIEVVAHDFLSAPLDTQVLRLCARLGLPAPTAACPAVIAADDPQPPAWQGSG